jgi:hypothetical protein
MKTIHWLGWLLLFGLAMFVFGRSTGRGANADQEPSQRSAETAAGLDRLVGPFDFTHATLRDALTEILKGSTGNVVIDWPALEKARLDHADVHVKVDAPVRLGTLLHLLFVKTDAGLYYERAAFSVLESAGVIISTESQIGHSFAVMRIYDIRDLIAAEMGPPDSGVSRTEAVDAYIKLIEDTVLSDSWKDNGGAVGSIREIGSQLIVVQTLEGHRQIANLLHDLRSSLLEPDARGV